MGLNSTQTSFLISPISLNLMQIFLNKQESLAHKDNLLVILLLINSAQIIYIIDIISCNNFFMSHYFFLSFVVSSFICKFSYSFIDPNIRFNIISKAIGSFFFQINIFLFFTLGSLLDIIYSFCITFLSKDIV